MSDPGDEMFDHDDYPPNAEIDHAISHARLMVERATPEASEVCFDYELVAAILKRYDKMRDALEFVRSDPCFKLLGTVTHDTVTDALGLTKILDR